MTTAILSHTDCLRHVTPRGAPEQVARLDYIMEALRDAQVMWLDAPLADDDDIALCHTRPYIDQIRARIPKDGFEALDGDTYLSPGSEAAIWRAVGGAVDATRVVLEGEADNAFVAVRPPGHHAEQAVAMGFCVFGNVAIAAKKALEHHGLERVAVVDFDVHHGNGTQALLQDDPRALVVTSHQMPLWPGTGEASDKGPHGTVMNLPLAPYSSGDEALELYRKTVVPAVMQHNPDMLFISAGFDAHQDDPLAQLNWSVDTFRQMTRMLTEVADDCCGGRLVSVLEGGYDLDALASSVRAHVDVLIEATQ